MALLEVSGLEAGYGIVKVLFGLDFHVDEGESVVILGANGAGKTSTLRALSGMIPAKGKVSFGGNDVSGKRPDQLAKLGVAHVPQGRGTIVDLTVDENLQMGGYLMSKADLRTAIGRWYDAFPRLGERKDQKAGSMSGGEQQMLAIARAFMSQPKLILLDEPSLGLAPLITREVFERVDSLVKEMGTSVLLVEQNANLALEFSTRAYVLEAGRISAEGTAEEMKGDDAIRKAYLGS